MGEDRVEIRYACFLVPIIGDTGRFVNGRKEPGFVLKPQARGNKTGIRTESAGSKLSLSEEGRAVPL